MYLSGGRVECKETIRDNERARTTLLQGKGFFQEENPGLSH